VIPDLGEDLISLFVSCIECYSSCMRFEGWKLGFNEWWVVGVFIAPTTKLTVDGGCCRMTHRTVRCATGHCPVRHRTLSGAPAKSSGRWVLTVGASNRWATGQSGGAPDSHCSLSGAPSDACSDFCARSEHCSLFLYRCKRPLALGAVAPLGAPDSPVVHRTVRWIIAERLPEISKVSSLELSSLVHRTLSGGTPDSPVRQTRAAFGLSFALFIWTLSWSFYWFVVNLWHL
jgi:hypothetical protein